MRIGWLIVLLAIGVAGCTRGPTLVPVTGEVAFNGKPVVPGSVHLEPVDGPDAGVMRASSLLQLDGSFTIRTYPHGEGAMPGKYRIYLQLGPGTKPDLALFTDVTKSPLLVDVPEAGLKGYHLELAEYTRVRKK